MAAVRDCLVGALDALDAAGSVGPWRMTLGRLQREVDRALLARVGLPALIRVAVPPRDGGSPPRR